MKQLTQTTAAAAAAKPLTIGQVARRAGVGVETVRFYEREGLLPRPARRASGYRQYPRESVARLNFIRRAKALGFTLKEVADLLDLRLDPRADRGAVKQRAAAKVEDIDKKIEDLRRMRRALVELSDACSGRGELSGCPILGALEGEQDEPDEGPAADADGRNNQPSGQHKECHHEHGSSSQAQGRGVQRRVPGLR